MKNNFGKTMAIFSALSLSGAMLMSGCTTVTHQLANGSTVTNSVPDPIVLRMVATEAATVGTQAWLAKNPQDADKFDMARKSLRGLLAVGGGTVADLQKALSLLPVDQLTGTNGQVIVTAASVVISQAGQWALRFDTKNIWPDYIEPLARGLADGLDAALPLEQP
jgi:hypothetical protein